MVRYCSGLILLLLVTFFPAFAADNDPRTGDSTQVVSPSDSSKTQDSLAQVKTVSPAQATTQSVVVVITSEPSGAALFVNDSASGITPVTLSGILPGNYTLTLKMKGYYQKKAEIAVDGKDTLKVHFDLLKPAAILFTSTPPGAQVKLNGTIKGVTPLFDKAVKPGEYKVSITLNNYSSKDTTVSFGNGAQDTLAFTMSKATVKDTSTVTAASKGEKNSGTAGTDTTRPMSTMRKYSGIIGAVAFGIFAFVLLIGERKDL